MSGLKKITPDADLDKKLMYKSVNKCGSKQNLEE